MECGYVINLQRKKVNNQTTVQCHSRRNLSYLFQTVVLNNCGCTPRGVRGVKRPEILWEIQKYSLPGRPSSQNWVKLKTIKKFIKIHQKMANCFWFYSILAGWLTWQWVFLNFSQNFWSFDTPDTLGCASAVFAENEIWNRLKRFLPVCSPGHSFFVWYHFYPAPHPLNGWNQFTPSSYLGL